MIIQLLDKISWERLTKVGKSRVVASTILVPFIGYLIIFNEEFIKYFELSRVIFSEEPIYNGNVSENTIGRLFYIYFGLFFLGVGSVFYQLFCPTPIRENSSVNQLIATQHAYMTPKRIDTLMNNLSNKIKESNREEFENIDMEHGFDEAKSRMSEQEYKNFIVDLMVFNWECENFSAPFLRASVAITFVLGFGVLSIPTVGTFIQVLVAFVEKV